jgi:hypothetical protein
MDFKNIISQISEDADLVEEAENIIEIIKEKKEENSKRPEVYGNKKLAREAAEIMTAEDELKEFRAELENRKIIPIDKNFLIIPFYREIVQKLDTSKKSQNGL